MRRGRHPTAFLACLLMLAHLVGVPDADAKEDGDLLTERELRLSLTDLNGRRTDLTQFGGKALIVFFWAHYAAPATRLLAPLTLVDTRLREKGVQVVGIAVKVDKTESVMRRIRQYDVKYPTFIDDGPLAASLNVPAVPVVFLISHERRIVRRYNGPVEPDRLIRDAQTMLAGRGSQMAR